MRRTLALFATLLIGLTLAACGKTAVRNAAAQDKWIQLQADAADRAEAKAEADRKQRADDFAAALSLCKDGGCVQGALAWRSVTDIATAAIEHARADGVLNIPPPVRERDWTEKTASLLGAAAAVVLPLGNAAVSWHQSDNSVKQSGQQYQFLGQAVGSVADVARNAQPNVNVNGDYVPGTQHIGDSIVGDGNAARGSRIGDDVGRDQTGGDHTDIAVGGDQVGRDLIHDAFNGAPCTVTVGAGTGTTGTINPHGECVAGSGGG